MHPDRDTRIPVTVITGFLGSGKTTLLNHWVKQPELSDCAVLINEFGSVGLDHQLVKQVDEQVMLLDSGCICCSVQGSLATALQELFMKALRKEIKPFRRLIIETTGLADPAVFAGHAGEAAAPPPARRGWPALPEPARPRARRARRMPALLRRRRSRGSARRRLAGRFHHPQGEPPDDRPPAGNVQERQALPER